MLKVAPHFRERIATRFSVPRDAVDLAIEAIQAGILSGEFGSIRKKFGKSGKLGYWPGNGRQAYRCHLPDGRKVYAITTEGWLITAITERQFRGMDYWDEVRSGYFIPPRLTSHAARP